MKDGADDSKPCFFDIRIKVNFSVIRDYLANKNGLLRHFNMLWSAILVIVASCSLQNSLPSTFPELPLYPAVWCVAWLAVRRSAAELFAWPLLAGVLLDCGAFRPLGMSCILFAAAAYGARRAPVFFHRLPYPAKASMAGAVATGIWVAIRLMAFSSGMPFAERLALVPAQFLGGMAISAFCGAPLAFALLDLCAGLIYAKAGNNDNV